ncbi:hypothetical protein [Algibacter sp. 2305UL17-15]|uniref:DUF7467 domain-containing protein n=1 Tax=Algibacter sp. 2305UL17-15 TaxID=3231268 RepID=UPI00345AF938
MKKIILTTLGACLFIFACNTESIENHEDVNSTSSELSKKKKKKKKVHQPNIVKECKVLDADNCNNPNQPKSNFWWPETETDYTSGFFGTTDDHKLKFTEHDNGSAHLTGTTNAINGDCVVTIDVWFIGKMNWDDWYASGNDWKDEGGCSGDVKEALHYYKIDSKRSTITSAGSDCLVEGVYGLEQRPAEKYGVQVGPGGAIWDSNVGAMGLGTWGWITEILNENTNNCGDCDGKLTELTLQYNGNSPANITVNTKGKGKNAGSAIFDGEVQPGAAFTIYGNDDKGTLGTEITLNVDGNENTKIHTSCSDPNVLPGFVSGAFEVLDGASRNGGRLCSDFNKLGARLYVMDFNFLLDCEETEEECQPCDGKVTELTLEYNGNESANITVKTKGKGKNKEGAIVFEGTVDPGTNFSFLGNDDKGTLGTEIHIYIDGNLDQKIHTSCSVPIGPGAVFGNYTVITGVSRNGGVLCPTDYEENGNDDCDCDGKLTELDLEYSGDSALITVKTKGKGKNSGDVIFSQNVNNGDTIELNGNDDKGTLGTEITIYINGEKTEAIHTSCSDPNVVPGYVIGNFKVIRGASRNNGELCTI